MTWFLDSSAIIKLIVEESESKSLRAYLPASLVASRLSRLEVLRNVKRIEEKKLDRARERMNGFSYIEINEHVLRNAEEIALTLDIKTLDAIQAGSALFIKDIIQGVISYDKNLNGALTKLGIKVISPGA